MARNLASELRTDGATLLPTFIAGPVVVLDLDANSLTIACDAAAVTAAQHWGQLFADPSRSQPHCRPNAQKNVTCTQFSRAEILVVELADPGAWRTVSVIIGNYRNGRASMHAHMSKMRNLATTATCP